MTNPCKPTEPWPSFNVMILAAGLGERMRPLTNDIPKAMVQVGGKPLIGHTLDFLKALNPKKILINLHYKPDPLIAYLSNHPLKNRIIFSDESEKILDTGGGVKRALPHLGNQPFLVANCDAFFAPNAPNPYLALMKAYQGGVLLLVEDKSRASGYQKAGDFLMDSQNLLSRRGDRPQAPFVFTGLQILDPEFFKGIKGDVFSLNKIYDLAIKAKELKGLPSPSPWFHIGTP